MSFEHKMFSVASRDAAVIADMAQLNLDIFSASGWQLVTAYAAESPLNATISHHFILQRPKQQTTNKINEGASADA